MIFDMFVIGALGKITNDALKIEFLKSKHKYLTEQEKQEFMENKNRRFIHFTSKENAENIMKAGFLVPSIGVLKNHFSKTIDQNGKTRNADYVYMFDSENFSVDDYIRNLPKKYSPYNGCFEYYAVSTRPNEYELNNFLIRAQDEAITYEGRLDIDGTDTKLVKYVLDLDKEGKYAFSEVPLDYKYIPSLELQEKLNSDRKKSLVYNLRNYFSELKQVKTSLKKYKLEKDEYKKQIIQAKNFARANKQFLEEEKEKNYVFYENDEKIVVKNLGYEMIGGKKLQKVIAIKKEKDQEKNITESAKYFYMDEFNIDEISNDVGAKYFLNNYDSISEQEKVIPKYIGLPVQNLETGEVLNEYDETFDKNFKEYIDQKLKISSSLNNEKNKKNNLTSKIKTFFSRKELNFNDKKDSIQESSLDNDKDRKKLAELGYSSVEAMNKDDKNITILEDLKDLVKKDEEIIYKNDNGNDLSKNKEDKCL